MQCNDSKIHHICLALLAQLGEHLFQRSWVQIPARYSGWPGHYNNVGCSARLEISFELNLLPRVNKVTLLYSDCATHIIWLWFESRTSRFHVGTKCSDWVNTIFGHTSLLPLYFRTSYTNILRLYSDNF